MAAISEALLFTRSSPKLSRAEDWDKWEVDKHMYDLVRGPGVTDSTMYRRVVDPRLPQALAANGRRAVLYRAPNLAQLRLWLESDILKEAVAGGSVVHRKRLYPDRCSRGAGPRQCHPR
jgi:hypothetical protein